jgi:hypothetical protein
LICCVSVAWRAGQNQKRCSAFRRPRAEIARKRKDYRNRVAKILNSVHAARFDGLTTFVLLVWIG